MKKNCLKCKKEFIKKATCSTKEWATSKYCSQRCSNSATMIGTKRCIGRTPWNKGKKCPQFSGENNNFWKGGISKISRTERENIMSTIEYKLWHDSVFARDGYICQKYGTKGGDLQAHHILNFSSFPELRFAIDNGITLSKKAHREFHKIYGNKNNTKEQLVEFLNSSAQEA